MEDKIVLTINGTEYEMEEISQPLECEISPLSFAGKLYSPKRIEKKESTIPDKDRDWEIVSFRDKNPKHNTCIFEWRNKEGGYVLNSNPFVCCSLSDMLSSKYSGYEIHSVRRVSDGVEFKIGDRICSKNNPKHDAFTIIEDIQISGNNFIFLDGCPLQNAFHLGKPKVPLFTIDGVNIFEHDKFYTVTRKTFHLLRLTAYKEYNNKILKDECEYFSSEEKAKEYILNNKPIEVSYKEMEQILIKNYYPYDNFEDIRTFFKSKINL